MSTLTTQSPLLDAIAIVGMAGRFPGARSVAQFWRNQLDGIESISHFRVDGLEIPNAAEVAVQPDYVSARGILEDIDLFDPEFFGILPKEAELMDPQQRLFLECCWEAFENGGYDPAAFPGAAGVFAGSSVSTYFLSKLCATPGFLQKFTSEYQIGNYLAMMGNNLDFLSTRVSYKLNLRGPSFTLQAGCSTSLLAVCQACQSLLTFQCDMALAGGVSITVPQKRGYLYQDGGMGSPDGHCRTFDADARGTVFGSGVAVVLLKRLEDALLEGDRIDAVIRGFAVNNDGAAKVGYTAPGVEGQANVIALAHQAAAIDPATIGYVEAHGTATPLGDPIELAALKRAFRTDAKRFCAVGTAKTNVGHLDIAAGVTGLIHATHIVRDGKLPPTLHFTRPNESFDLDNCPFYVNTTLTDWERNGHPRRAGVSAFGVGGTNAHVVLEQAPFLEPRLSLRNQHLLLISARSSAALEAATENLAAHLEQNPALDLNDVAFTLSLGRRRFDHRRILIAGDLHHAVSLLRSRDPQRVITRKETKGDASVSFLFPGQGSQYPEMGREVYRTEPVFRQAVDECAELLEPHLGVDIRRMLYRDDSVTCSVNDDVTQTLLAQPAIFVIEYALAKLWMSWGISPRSMIGHSVGEFVAATLSKVFSLADALRLVSIRGRLMQGLPPGAMLSVRQGEIDLRPWLTNDLSLAAVNAPSLSVVSGPLDAVSALEKELTLRDIVHRRLHTSHAFHSSMMDPILEPFTSEVGKVQLSSPTIPYISGVTGNWITTEEATSAEYWARHARQTVNFSPGIKRLRECDDSILLEVGPGSVLSTLARQHTASSSNQVVVSSLTDAAMESGECTALQKALGVLWLAGMRIDWRAVHGEACRRVALPTYPFERKRFWLDSPVPVNASQGEASNTPQPISASPVDFVPNSIDQKKTPMTPAVSTNLTRREYIQTILCDIFWDLSGKEISQVGDNETFLDLGFDSLLLTQVTQVLQAKFKLKITFRQLLGNQSTIRELATYIEEKVPAEFFESKPQPVPPTTNSPPTTTVTNGHASFSAVEQLMRDQLLALNQLCAQQLGALQGTGPVSTSSAPVRVTSPESVVNGASRPQISAETNKAAESKAYTPFKPLQKSISGKLTDKQKDYIKRLVERYTERTSTSKTKTQEYRSVLADPRVVSGFRSQWKELVYPIITVRSKGSRLWDLDGNEYVDILNGFGPIMLGHRPDFVEKAVEKQLHEGFEIGPQTLLAGEVARALCEMTGNERATFCNTGSEAVIAAMRVARTVSGRNKVVYFSGDYHGMFDEVLVKGFKKGGELQSMPIAPGIPREKAANIIVLEYGAQEALDWIRNNSNDLAAVLVEPVQSRHPDLQPVQFLRELRAITSESDTCLIFDEVVTGFRVHPGGCQAIFNIRADLVTYGKVIGGGMPIGVLAGKAKYMDALDGGMWQYGDESYPETGVTFFAGTFVRHPLAMAACSAVLTYLKEQGPKLQERLGQRTAGLVGRLNSLLEENEVPTRIENFGSIFYFSFPSDFYFGSLFYYHLREKGIHLLEGFPCFLTTEHSDADLEVIVRAFAETIAEMQEGGALPLPTGKDLVSSHRHEHTAAQVSLTEAQREIWLAAQLSDEASCSFNESFTLRLIGDLDEARLRWSLQKLIDRHDSLRATFAPDGQSMNFTPRLSLDITFQDLAHLQDSERQDRFRAVREREARTSFDLMNGPLVRVSLFRFEAANHAMLFTSHHIVCDGWSTNVLLDELANLYSAGLGSENALPSPVSFSAYAQEQAKIAKGHEAEEVETYWLKQFEAMPPALELPVDHPRPAVKSFCGSTFRTNIDAETYKQIRKAGSLQGCTPFVILLAGFICLLHRLTAQDDIIVGVPMAGQSLLEQNALVGHCVNFLPLRTRFREYQSAAELLAETKQTLLDAYEHQAYTYGTLVRKLKMRRDPSRLPLVEVQFNLEKVGSDLSFGGLKVEVDPSAKAAVNFDLFLNIVESDKGLTLDCDYNTTLFDRETIARWLGHYETLLRGVAADANQLIRKLPILAEVQRHEILFRWNETSKEYPRRSVNQLIEEQTARTPDATAVSAEGLSLTYRDLDSRSNQLARYLIELGVQPNDLVGISTDRSPEMLIGLLGIWKAGAAYVPLDPAYPEARLRYILEQTAVPVLLTQARLADGLPPIDGKLLCLDRDWIVIRREATTAINIPADPERNAYIIFTSGSTGQPKGVEVTHRNLANLLCSVQSTPGLAASDRLLAVTTLSFDIAALELFLPLVVGAEVILASREVATDPMLLSKSIVDSKVNVMQATPATWRGLIESGWEGAPNLKILCGGEALPRELANDLISRGESVWNMYGPTETTVWSAVSRVELCSDPVTIGPPISNTELYVLDRFAQPLPIGVPGELYIGGDGVSRGYLHRPDLTAERFVDDPFSSRPGARLYRTGDLVRWRRNGRLEFMGRMDNQVKVHGFRIECGEIEAVLAATPLIRECAVIPANDEAGDKRLVAYIVPQEGSNPSSGDLRAWIRKSLPEYMIPTLFVSLPAMPQTPNGKIDRKALPLSNAMNLGPARDQTGPRNAQELRLLAICAEVLHLDAIGVHDNLFELGADSIHLFQIIARAGSQSVVISPQQILRSRTVAALVAELDQTEQLSSYPTAAQVEPKAVPREQYRVRLATAEA